MTSNSALSQFADLSPAQRQLLFEKLRQKKLHKERKPTQFSEKARDQFCELAPYHQKLLQTHYRSISHNRLVEVALQGTLNLKALQHALLTLESTYPILQAAINNQGAFVPAAESGSGQRVHHYVVSPAKLEEELVSAREKLQAQPNSDHVLHISLISTDTKNHHLMLACHPLALDSHSLLMLAGHLINLASTQDAKLNNNNAFDFAHWSKETLDKSFLNSEWKRLTPKESSAGKAVSSQTSRYSEFLSLDFLQDHLSAGENAKHKILETFQHCFSTWLAHQEIALWVSDPNLKDSSFDHLLGFFPYYVPVKTNQTGSKLNMAQQMTQLHTRYSSVSEQLANYLCQNGVQAPTIHYHWLDITQSTNSDILIQSAQHSHSGLMLSPLEIHATETQCGISLDLLFDDQKLSLDQVKFLFRDFKSLFVAKQNDAGRQRLSLPDQLREIWKDLLQLPEIAPEKNFFELGGHSLQVTEMKFRIKQQLKLDIPISVLYELPTIEQMSNFILATHGSQLGLLQTENSDSEEELEEGTL